MIRMPPTDGIAMCQDGHAEVTPERDGSTFWGALLAEGRLRATAHVEFNCALIAVDCIGCTATMEETAHFRRIKPPTE